MVFPHRTPVKPYDAMADLNMAVSEYFFPDIPAEITVPDAG